MDYIILFHIKHSVIHENIYAFYDTVIKLINYSIFRSVPNKAKPMKPKIDIDFAGLKEHFWVTQEKHREGRRKPHSFKIHQSQEAT